MLRASKSTMPTLPRQPSPLNQGLPKVETILTPSYSEIVQVARKAFNRGTTKSLKFRIEQLHAMDRLFVENEHRFIEALQEDMNKPKYEVILMEIENTRNDIRCMLMNINKWSKPDFAEKSLVTLFDKTYIVKQPYGVVLVMGAWNYPVQLSIGPMVGAITAGNCVILKPSEVASATSNLFSELIPRYLDQDCYHVVTGGVNECNELLKERFDYIFFTGSVHTGQIVREAANKYLTPVTLELGGKSPVYLDNSVDFEISCKRLLWGKCTNLGQTCVAPDYLLCTPEIQDKFVNSAKKLLKEFYGEDPKSSPDLARIVNDKQFQRLIRLLKLSGNNVAIGGRIVEEERFIYPTILTNVNASDPIMKEEIFGPILPIITVKDHQEAIKFINSREKPLTLYIFSTNKEVIENLIKNTCSGSVCVNDTIIHLAIDALPFGGVGMSGMGRYHGKFSFDTFSHQKAVLERNYNYVGEKMSEARYPPYSDAKIDYIRFMTKRRASIIPPYTGYILSFLFGVILVFVIQYMIDLF
ncbi:aldehyde dehydrogenase, dimeric NADP-preferring-like isoform X2 [Centruroides vittatus]|uniref:aldehyde dehydrogenase, dimeric NADP-preferring-like isoform X2 n=1 Tax=Centruroides vittatus TaxID=120091 RepID=UPI00350F49BB